MNDEFNQERYEMTRNKAFELFYKYEYCFTSHQSKNDAYEYLDYDEFGLGIGLICIALIRSNVALTQEEYDFVKYLRGDIPDNDDDDGEFSFKLTDLKVLSK